MNLASKISANTCGYMFLRKLFKFHQADNIHDSEVAKLFYIFGFVMYSHIFEFLCKILYLFIIRFYKGLPPLWMRQIPYTMMKFACFERTVEFLYKHVVPKPR